MNKRGRGAYKHGDRASSTGQQQSRAMPTPGQTLLILAAILFLAFLLRSFFAYGPSIGNDFALSGGSDAVYYERVIEYILATGQQLLIEPMHNYPHEANNLREPLYAWSVVLGGLFLSLFGVPIDTAVGMSFMFSTPVFGTLSIIPVYLIAREAFGERVGLIAAALMAVSSGAISLSVLSDADHDALAMFFILWSFYFLIRALERLSGQQWVASWMSKASISYGLRSFVKENRIPLLLALMSGMCMALAAMTWKGYVYALVIITMFLVAQLLIDRFSNRDSMGLLLVYAIMGFSTVILSLPYYLGMNQGFQWWGLPIYIVIGGTLVALLFSITRDKPWTLTLPSFALLSAVALVFLYLFYPGLFTTLVTGAGYFGEGSREYATIAEAQAPSFSALALAFGVITIWLAFIGAVWSAWKIVKVRQPFYVFIVVWMLVAILMASSAQRFIFNSSMAFAIAAAVTINIIIAKADLREYYHNIRSAEWRVKWRRALKPMPFATVLFMTLLVATPNVWVAFDASIPNNTKADYDQQIYDGLPSFLRPDDYSHGDLHFLGSTGYRITTHDNWYFMDAWDWLSEQNNHIYPEHKRPAFLSWWDYGFEAAHYGKHPTVAENFLRGHQMAAAFITAQSEAEAIALMIVRILETETFSDEIKTTLAAHGVNAAQLEDRIHNPEGWIQPILNNPDLYGRYASDMTAANARYIASSQYLASTLGTNELADLYHDLRAETGFDIGYFAIDSRLFPWSFRSMGIFSAPALLGGHLMDEFGLPADFYEIYAIVNGQPVPLNQLTPNMQVSDYVLVYNDKLYESMMWRTFMGFNPTDLGITQQGIPGMAGSLAEYESMQGWGLNHFRMVYRTAMYNPFDNFQDHPDAWTFISYDQAQELKVQISAGKATGVIDDSTSALRNGVVFLQYYDGVEISGTVKTEHGDPLEGVYVTVYDEYGIPHMVEETDADGKYKVLAPFGDVEVKFSTGEYDKRMMRGASVMEVKDYSFTYSQAMRADNAVVPASAGHQVSSDVVLPSASVDGKLLLDSEGMEGAKVSFVTDTATRNTTAAADGSYSLSGLVPTTGRLVIEYNGQEVSNTSLSLRLGQTKTFDLNIASADVSATLKNERGEALGNLDVNLKDTVSGAIISSTSDADGVASFTGLLPGRYTLSLGDSNLSVGPVEFRIGEGESKELSLTVKDAMTLSGITQLQDSTAVGDVSLTFSSPELTMRTVSDADGNSSIVLPQGEYTLYAHGFHAGKEHSHLSKVNVSDSPSHDIEMSVTSVLRGKVSEGGASLILTGADGEVIRATASSNGNYRFAVPAGHYSLLASSDGKAAWQSMQVAGTTVRDITLKDGATVTGTVGYDINADGDISEDEGLRATLRITDAAQRSIKIMSDEDGLYFFTVPNGNYVLDVMKDGYVSKSIDLNAISGSVYRDVHMLPEDITVSGAVSEKVTIDFQAVGSGAVSKSVTSAGGSYSVSLRPGEYDVRVWENAVPGNETVVYKHESSLDIAIGSEPISKDIDLKTMIKTVISNLSTSDTVRIGGVDGKLNGKTTHTIYLEEGEQSIYAQRGDTHAYFASHTVNSTNRHIDVDWQTSRLVTGELRHDGNKFDQASGDLVVSKGAAEMVFEVSNGKYSIRLPDGVYDLQFSFDTIEDERYYQYTHSSSVTVSGATINNLDLTRSLHNVTLDYEVLRNNVPHNADIWFIANSPSAIDAKVTDKASGSISIAPGKYTVYAVKGERVYLDTIEVIAFDDLSVTMELERGNNLIGTFLASGKGVQAEATITDGDATMPLSSSSNGIFDIHLPQGYYSISASATVTERTMDVDYSADVAVSLTSNINNLQVHMGRDDQRGLSLSYDDSVRTVAGGKSFTVSFNVVNDGNVNETVTLQSNSWPMSFKQNEFKLPFGSQNAKTVSVTVTAPADAAVEHSDVKVIARGADGSTLGTMTVNTAVVAAPSVSLSYEGAKTASGQHYDYELRLHNDGNVRDTFALAVNSDSLQDRGWSVSLLDSNGNALSQKELSAFDHSTVIVRLTPISGMAQAEPSVTVTASSAASSDAVTFTGSLPNVVVSADRVGVSGSSVYSDAGGIGTTTWILLVLTISSITLFILMGRTRGVFSRRKR